MSACSCPRPHVLSYSRISSDTEGDAHGVEDHLERNRVNAEALGWHIISELEDNDLTASDASVYRPAFEALLKALLTGSHEGQPVEGVIIYEQSRIARTQTAWERFVDAITCKPGRVYAEGRSVHDIYSDAFDLHGTFGTYVNKMESRKIKRRTKDSHHTRAMRGQSVGGTRPFGWMKPPPEYDETGELLKASPSGWPQMHPVEGPAAHGAAQGFIAGKSLHALVMELQKDGLTTTLGNQWTTTSLKKFLLNPRLCGLREINGQIVYRDGAPVVGEWDALIGVEEWEAIRARFDARKGEKKLYERKYLLSGFLRCGKCLGPLRASPLKDGGHMYVCPAKSQGGCGGIGRNGIKVDNFVSGAVLARIEFLESGAGNDETPDEWPGETKLQNAIDKRSVMNTAWLEGTMSDETYFSQLETLEAVIKRLRKERGYFQAAKAQRAAGVGDTLREWASRMDDLSWKRSVIHRNILSVMILPNPHRGGKTFHPESVRIHWRED